MPTQSSVPHAPESLSRQRDVLTGVTPAELGLESGPGISPGTLRSWWLPPTLSIRGSTPGLFPAALHDSGLNPTSADPSCKDSRGPATTIVRGPKKLASIRAPAQGKTKWMCSQLYVPGCPSRNCVRYRNTGVSARVRSERTDEGSVDPYMGS
ncbi:hypothetical protein MJG53_005499 [Ovis ammon polii x Ovis aries]|uniref:Uncharacterized protein n=1 Tax=Ovis ammon polii x Ovis aries TaxID=2918886 RepID=A0ACB9VD49_9CETA|nr:hypothetical protein MJG53_005499 [Ovis ammon polii x Ovis aries]